MKEKVVRGSEEINSIGGISLIGGLFNYLKNMKKVDLMQTGKVKTGQMSHSDILKSTAALFALGKNDYAIYWHLLGSATKTFIYLNSKMQFNLQ